MKNEVGTDSRQLVFTKVDNQIRFTIEVNKFMLV